MSIWNIFRRKKPTVMEHTAEIIRRLKESGLRDVKDSEMDSEMRPGGRAITLLITESDFPDILFDLGIEDKYPALAHHSHLISSYLYFRSKDDVFIWNKGKDEFYKKPDTATDIIIGEMVSGEYADFAEEVRMLMHGIVREITGIDLLWQTRVNGENKIG